MKNLRLGCFSASGIVVTLLTLAFIFLINMVRAGVLFSPGGLNAQAGTKTLGGVHSHADLTNRCGACHPAFWTGQRMTDLCLSCHTELASDPTNFHVLMKAEGMSQGCQHCHTDHHGPAASMVSMDLSQFPHNSLRFSLQAHQKMADGTLFTCADCHGSQYASFDPAVCAQCHTPLKPDFMQAHLQAFGAGCLACHDGLETYGKSFDHNKVKFTLTGKHAGLDCVKCHAGMTTILALQSTSQQCISCHQKDDPHQGQLGQDCAACHVTDGWNQVTYDHSKAAFQLTGKHAQVQCKGCHTDMLFKSTPQDCASCHAKNDPHKGQLGQDCATCHVTDDWKQVNYDHSKAAFTLIGKHVDVPCQNCHTTLTFKDTPQDCVSCHAKDDFHKGQFGTDCSLCHTPVDWKQVTFDHAKSAFPLTGAHVRVACTSCHVNGKFKGTPTACAACHADPSFHKGLLGSNCGACHNTSGWTPAKFNRSHSFPINHGGAGDCRSCHPSYLGSYSCYSCHNQADMVNKHQGVSDLSKCANCHPNGTTEGGGGGGG